MDLIHLSRFSLLFFINDNGFLFYQLKPRTHSKILKWSESHLTITSISRYIILYLDICCHNIVVAFTTRLIAVKGSHIALIAGHLTGLIAE